MRAYAGSPSIETKSKITANTWNIRHFLSTFIFFVYFCFKTDNSIDLRFDVVLLHWISQRLFRTGRAINQ